MKQAIASAMPMHATQTTRQASHPSRLPSSFFGERSAEASFEVLVAMPPNLRSLICEGLGQAALKTSEKERWRQPRSSGFSSHCGQYGRVIVHALFPHAAHLSWNAKSWMEITTRACTIDAPHSQQSSVFPSRRHRHSRNSFSESLNSADVI